jgi:hypothetical protein
MTQQQKEYLADGLREVANWTVGALLLGQFLAQQFNWIWTIVGLGVWLAFYWAGVLLLKEEGKES